jgi:hypothetical protein
MRLHRVPIVASAGDVTTVSAAGTRTVDSTGMPAGDVMPAAGR